MLLEFFIKTFLFFLQQMAEVIYSWTIKHALEFHFPEIKEWVSLVRQFLVVFARSVENYLEDDDQIEDHTFLWETIKFCSYVLIYTVLLIIIFCLWLCTIKLLYAVCFISLIWCLGFCVYIYIFY